MGRVCKGWFWSLLLLLAAQLELVRAGEHKSDERTREIVAVTSFQSSAFSSTTEVRSYERRKAEGPLPQLKPVTLFRFQSRFGEVAVQPVVGAVKGAQLSLDF